VITRFASLVLVGLGLGGGTVSAQESAVEVELDAFWAEVVRSVEEWSVEAQRATYHPDAISVSGDSGSYGTKLMSEAFDEAVGEGVAPSNPRLTFRFSSRVHDTSTAHEVGLYRFLADGQEPFYGGVDSYLVKKDGRWVILLEIQRREGLSEAEWDALGGSF
jgi:hypothetical protein